MRLGLLLRLVIIQLLLISQVGAQSSLPLQEHFNYSPGDLSSQSAIWQKFNTSPTSVDVQIVNGNLSYPGYPMVMTGNQLQMSSGLFGANEGIIDYLVFDPVPEGQKVYVSFLLRIINLNDLTVGGNFFAGISDSNNSLFKGYSQIWIRQSAGNTFNLGLSKNTDSEIFWENTSYTPNTTYLVVLSYEVVTGIHNDIVKLWINPNLDGTEPSANITIGAPSIFADGSIIETFYLRQTVEELNANIDAIRISNTWSMSPLPVELTSFSASSIGKNIKLSWNTATEVNNYGFEIERSVVKGEWNKIGFVNGNGNSNSPKNYSFVDDKVSSGKYSYRLKQIDNDGQFEYSKTIEIDVNGVKKFELAQNYPNPFNPTTTIQFQLPQTGWVKLTLYNILGQEIKTLVNEVKEAGTHTVNFDASELNSGVYIYRIESGSYTQTQKMTLIK